MTDMFITRTNAILAKVLDGTAERHKVIADNIANAETPGYTRKLVSFENTLVNIIQKHEPDKQSVISVIQNVEHNPQDDVNSIRRENGNNVNIEHEMVELAKNTLQYEMAAQFMSDRINGLRSAIKEGKG
jgi:flagellar basal-body rod protein FlgB